MIVLKRNRDDIRTNLEKAFSISGFDTADGIVREIVAVVTDNLETDYMDIYSLQNNVRIDSADNGFLDHYGVLLDEPRAAISFARVDDLSSIYLTLTNSNGVVVPGNSITRTGAGLFIEKGTLLLDETDQPLMRTLHSVELSEERVYVKAISIDSDLQTIAPGTLSAAQVDLLSDPDVDDALVGDLFLRAHNLREIRNNVVDADEDTYRYVLQEKARSVNLTNEHKINTVFDNLNIRSFTVKRINPASTSLVVYIATTNTEIDSLVTQEVQQQIMNIMPYGMDIRVRPYVTSTVTASLKVSTVEDFDVAESREAFRESFVSAVNALEPNSLAAFDAILRDIRDNTPAISNAEFDYIAINNRKLAQPVYRMRDIERVYAYPSTVSYRV